MIGSYLVGGTATTVIAHWSVTVSTIATSTLTAANEWGHEPISLPFIERRRDRQATRPWVASSVAGRIPVVVELRAKRAAEPLPMPRARHRRPTWASALRAFHRDPTGVSREALR